MAFGQTVGSIKNLRKNLKNSSGSGTWIKYVGKAQPLNVRFLTDPEGWVKYQEVWDDVRRTSYPVPEEGMPGYPTRDQRVSTVYLTNALDVDADRVIPLMLKSSLAEQLVNRYDRYETLMDRDYELSRTGEGMKDTAYLAAPEPATKRNMGKYKLLDLLDVLKGAYEDVWGEQEDVDESTPAPRGISSKAVKRVKKATKPKAKKNPPQPDLSELVGLCEVDDGDAQEKLTSLALEVGIDADEYDTWQEVMDAMLNEPTPAVDDDTDEDEEAEEDDAEEAEDEQEDPMAAFNALLATAEAADGGDEESESVIVTAGSANGVDTDEYETWTEAAEAIIAVIQDSDDSEAEAEENEDDVPDVDDLEAMTLGEVRAVARDNGITTKGKTKAALIAALAPDAGADEDEDEPF